MTYNCLGVYTCKITDWPSGEDERSITFVKEFRMSVEPVTGGKVSFSSEPLPIFMPFIIQQVVYHEESDRLLVEFKGEETDWDLCCIDELLFEFSVDGFSIYSAIEFERLLESLPDGRGQHYKEHFDIYERDE